MSIQTNNSLQIRQPFEVHCGLMANEDIAITYTVAGDVAVMDSNISDALSNPTWSMRAVTDFFPSGIPLDGSEVFLNTAVPASSEDGKIGIRADVGEVSFIISGTAQKVIPAVTIFFDSGAGTVTHNSISYIIRSAVVVPINATSFTLTVTSSGSDERVVISSITAGTQIEWTTDDIISVNLDLRSNLDLTDPSFEISEIEIRAYYPDDISEAVAAIGDGEPVWYYAGIDGDYSEIRNFYISDTVVEENNVIKISAEDRSEALEDVNVPIQRLEYTLRNSRRSLYRWMIARVEEAGISASRETEPGIDPDAKSTKGNMVFLEGSARDHLANIMAYARNDTYGFYPRYVDAGIPKIEWSKPTAKWDIYEEDCGEIKDFINRNIAKIKTDDDYGVLSEVTLENDWTTIEKDISVKNNKRITKNFGDQWYWNYKADHVKSWVWTLLDTVQWISNTTGTTTLQGKECDWTRTNKSVSASPKRNGSTEKISPMVVGVTRFGDNKIIMPNYTWVFNRSNKGGSFTWKGDPRMQPRDVFRFHRLDGTVEECTIETIELTHEDGGTIAEISYRKGVV